MFFLSTIEAETISNTNMYVSIITPNPRLNDPKSATSGVGEHAAANNETPNPANITRNMRFSKIRLSISLIPLMKYNATSPNKMRTDVFRSNSFP